MFLGSKKWLSVILLSLPAVSLLGVEAFATQVIENSDWGHVQVPISAHETNRLMIEGRRITTIVPSVKGVLSSQKDELLGAYYFTLASASPNHGTVTVFVSDDKGITYQLILVPQTMAGEEIIIRPPSTTAASSRRADSHRRAAAYQRRVKALMLAMADENLNDGVDTMLVNQQVPLWKESHLVLRSQHRDGDLIGEKYRLTNVSAAALALVEQQLYRRGVHAVAIDKHTLLQGESTDIYLIREPKDDE